VDCNKHTCGLQGYDPVQDPPCTGCIEMCTSEEPEPVLVKTLLDLAYSERDDVIRAAARMANALNDIYAINGEVEDVSVFYHEVENDVQEYMNLDEMGK